MSGPSPNGAIEWGVATLTLRGEAVSGDTHLVTDFPGGALAAVIDGLGHGPEAAYAAQTAAETLVRQAGAPVASLIHACHADLRKTRGVVMSLASFTTADDTMTWAGVGDVEGVLFRAGSGTRDSILLRGGVIGYQLPPLREARVAVGPGDLVVIATDGVRRDFAASGPDDRAPQAIADDLLDRHAKGTDDALVLVVRYQGGRG